MGNYTNIYLEVREFWELKKKKIFKFPCDFNINKKIFVLIEILFAL